MLVNNLVSYFVIGTIHSNALILIEKLILPMFIFISLIAILTVGVHLIKNHFNVSEYYYDDDYNEKMRGYILLLDILMIYKEYLNKNGYFIRYNELKDIEVLDKERQKNIIIRDVYIQLSKMCAITNNEHEKFQLIMYKYEETLEIIYQELKKAENLSLLGELSIHEKNFHLLNDPLREIKTIQHMELEKIQQELEDEVKILKDMRRRTERTEAFKLEIANTIETEK